MNWRYIVNKLKNPDGDFCKIMNSLGLSKWEGQYVALRNFQVIDSDFSLNELVQRLWDKTPNPDIVIVPTAGSKDVFTLEF